MIPTETAVSKSSKIGVLKNFAIFIGKHLCWSLFLIRDSNARVFL